MNLVILAHTLKNEPLSQPITGRFDERGGTIGRSDTNTLALPDPERHISRLHAEVWFSNGAFSIRNVGSANAIIVNGRPISPGEGSAIGDGDELSIGAYAMRVSLAEPSQGRPADQAMDGRTVIKSSASEHKTAAPHLVPPGRAATEPLNEFTQSPSGAVADPFADLFGAPAGASASGPFADLLGSPAAAPPSSLRPTPVVAAKRAAATPPSAPVPLFQPPPPVPAAPAPTEAAPGRLPDDFDPFADLGPAPAGSAGLGSFMDEAPPPAPAPAGSAPIVPDIDFGDLLGSPAAAPASSLDDIFGLDQPAAGRAAADPLADFLAPPKDKPAGAGLPAGNTDPMAMFGEPPAPPAPLPPRDFDRTPELKGAYKPPAVQARAPDNAMRTIPRPADPPTVTRPLSPPADEAGSRRPRGPVAPGSEPAFTRASSRSVSQMAETTMPAVRVSRPMVDDFTSAPLPLPRVPMPPTSPSAAPPPSTPLPTATSFEAAAASPARPPAPAAAVPVAAAPVPPASPAGEHSNEALWAAFCEGAGIRMNLPQGLNPGLMRILGEVLQHSVDGTLKLVAVRAAAKSELRAQVTTIQSRNNNPLKFSPDAASAIEQLLQPPMRGFMVGPAAVTDVMDDLLGHAIGTMAGMRAALAGVLQRFEPSQLENKLSGNSLMDTVLPMHRRAKLWELYLQHFKRIEGDAEEDFHELFGKAFMRAYEDQLDLLDKARHPDV